MSHSDSSEGALRKYNTPLLRIRVTTTPKKTCLKDLSRATLALALTPYAQATDLAVNTAASDNNAAAIQSLDESPPSWPQSWTAACWRRRLTGGRAWKQHRSAAELADHGSLQQGRPVGLRRAGGRSDFALHRGRNSDFAFLPEKTPSPGQRGRSGSSSVLAG